MQVFEIIKDIAQGILTLYGLFLTVRYSNSKENRQKTEAEARKLNAEASLLELEYEKQRRDLEQ
ncbi:hypothetical protein H7U04_10975 [Streptococcus sp. 22.1]|jgi:hypothetical protein|uniref:hypothetical protein n=1 Tax=Streptococcus sp. 22.1 TaxID=2762565 RepID=UPI001912E717|nr:hypothetical protein [Streptococcus sp. 22.1]MBK5079889.1 hypothetical protein [Streptococcus sp. 22.1]